MKRGRAGRRMELFSIARRFCTFANADAERQPIWFSFASAEVRRMAPEFHDALLLVAVAAALH